MIRALWHKLEWYPQRGLIHLWTGEYVSGSLLGRECTWAWELKSKHEWWKVEIQAERPPCTKTSWGKRTVVNHGHSPSLSFSSAFFPLGFFLRQTLYFTNPRRESLFANSTCKSSVCFHWRGLRHVITPEPFTQITRAIYNVGSSARHVWFSKLHQFGPPGVFLLKDNHRRLFYSDFERWGLWPGVWEFEISVSIYLSPSLPPSVS